MLATQAAIKEFHENFNQIIKFIADRTYLQPLPIVVKTDYADDLSNRIFPVLMKAQEIPSAGQTQDNWVDSWNKLHPDIVSKGRSNKSRMVHSVMHACRVVMYIDILHNFKKDVIHKKETIPFPTKAL